MSRDVSRRKDGTKLSEEFTTPAYLFSEREPEDVLKDKFEHPGDSKKSTRLESRPRLNSTRALQEEPMHAYMVRGSNNLVPHAVVASMNPDVSGFTNQLCQSAPRSTNAGDESVGAIREELGSSSKRR